MTPILLSFEGTKPKFPAKNSSIPQPSAYKIFSFIPEKQAALTTFDVNVPAHTQSFAYRDSECCMSRSTHALLPLTLRELSQLTAVTQKDVRVRPSSTCQVPHIALTNHHALL